jgi:hypothetical protein
VNLKEKIEYLYNGDNTLVITPEPLTEEELKAKEDLETFEAEQKFDRIKQERE